MNRFRLIAILMLIPVVIAACNLGAEEQPTPTTTPLLTPTTAARPSIAITSPDEGDEVVANQPVLVEVSTTGNADSVELFVNGNSVQEVRISDPSGSSSRSVLNFTPTNTGSTTLRVIAYRNNLESNPAEVTISVRQSQAFVTATSQGPIINPNDPTCRALVNAPLNFRRQPSVNSEVIRVLGAGEVLPIIGRTADNTWLQLRSNTSIGWVSANFVTRYGNCAGLIIVSPPATPLPTSTPRPTNTSVPLPTATIRPTETPQPKPNLVVTTINGPTEVTIPSGESSITVEYNVAISNIGGILNEQFLTAARILPAGDEFDFGVIGSLGANQSININGKVTFTTPGTYALQFIADSENDIDEIRENDNSGIIDVKVIAG